MDQFSLPRLRARALPPIGRRRSFTASSVVFRALLTFSCALAVLLVLVRGPRGETAGAAPPVAATHRTG